MKKYSAPLTEIIRIPEDIIASSGLIVATNPGVFDNEDGFDF